MSKLIECESVSIELEQAQLLLSLIFEEIDDVPRRINTKDDQIKAFVFCGNRVDIIEALSRSIFSILESQRHVLNQLAEEGMHEQKDSE